MEQGAATEGKEVPKLMKEENEDESTEKLTVEECWLSEDVQSNSPVQGSCIASEKGTLHGKEVNVTELVKVGIHMSDAKRPDYRLRRTWSDEEDSLDGWCDDTSSSADACLPKRNTGLAPLSPYEKRCVLPKSPQGKHRIVLTKSRPGNGFNTVKFNKVKTFDLRGVQSIGSSKRSANFPDDDSSMKKKKLI